MPKRSKATRDQDGIYQRPDSPYWWGTWTKPGGGTARRSTGVEVAADPRGIEAKRARARMMVEAGAAPEAAHPGRTWDELMEAYLDQVQKAPRTMERDRRTLRPLYREFSGRMLAGITGADIRAYRAKREEDGVMGSTIGSEIRLMGAATAWAIKELDWPIPNPWAGRAPAAQPPRARWLTRDEAAALIDAAERLARRYAPTAYLPDWIRLCLYTGLRPGEAVALEWRRVDLAAGLILFDAGHGVGGQKSGKAGSVPINQQARVALLSRERARQDGCPWVFPGRTGGPMKRAQTAFERAVEVSGLADVHPHDLRRTFGSWLAQEGVPLQQISRLMRHEGIDVTHRVYAHLAPQTLADAAGVLDQSPKLKVVK